MSIDQIFPRFGSSGVSAAAVVVVTIFTTLTTAAFAQPGELAFETADSLVSENVGNATINLTRTGGTTGDVSVRVRIASSTWAVAGEDYERVPGTLDGSFDVGTGFTGVPVYKIIELADGKILVAGAFTAYDGMARQRILRLNADGTLDTSFDTAIGADGLIADMAVQPDGKIIIVGDFANYKGVGRNRIARLEADGALDLTFDPGVGINDIDAVVHAVALQADDKILIGGNFGGYDGTFANCLARVEANGTLDATFDIGSGPVGGSPAVYDIAVQPDGQIVVVGNFTQFAAVFSYGIVRLDPDGSRDATFNSGSGAGLNKTVTCVHLQADGTMYLGGNFETIANNTRQKIAKLEADGALSTTFVPPSKPFPENTFVFGIDTQPDGRVIVVGNFTSLGNVERIYVARMNTDGTVDASFDSDVADSSGRIRAVAVRADGRILLGGEFDTVGGVARGHFAQLRGDWVIEWADGDDAVKSFELPIIDDAIFEGDDAVDFELYAAAGGATIGTPDAHRLTIIDDDSNPTVISVTSSAANGAYSTGNAIPIVVTFNRPVNIDTNGGTPTIALNSGGTASYTSGNGGTALSFTYTVGSTDVTADLDYTNTNALQLNGGSITGGGLPAILTLPAPGAAGSLGANKDIAVNYVPGIEIRRGAALIALGGSDAVGNAPADGTELVLTYTVENTGASALTITAITVTGETNATATIDGTIPTTITVGNFETYTLTVIPAAVGAFSCTIEITSNLAGNPTVTFTVTGTGTAGNDDGGGDNGAAKGGCGALPTDGTARWVWVVALLVVLISARLRRRRYGCRFA